MPEPIERPNISRILGNGRVTSQIVNTDIDGLLTGALLWEWFRIPIIGFYDTQHLWASSKHLVAGKVPLDSTVWVDVDMCWPGSTSLSQHIICKSHADKQDVLAFGSTINPNLEAGITFAEYTPKYPFGTFQWLWWCLGIAAPDPEDEIRTGISWMPDGGFESAQGPWARNCREWATERLPGSPMESLYKSNSVSLAPARVGQAMAELIRLSGAPSAKWRNMQYVASRRTRSGFEVLCDPRDQSGQDELNSLLAAIARIFGWSATSIPTEWEMHSGTWASKPPNHESMRRWTSAANNREIVSCAFIDKRTFAFTRPKILTASSYQPNGEIADVLP